MFSLLVNGDKMKLWKENRLDQEHELANKEIAKQFLGSIYGKKPYEFGGIATALVYFIGDKTGLNSSWEWNEEKGSINGSKDMLEIIDIVRPQITS